MLVSYYSPPQVCIHQTHTPKMLATGLHTPQTLATGLHTPQMLVSFYSPHRLANKSVDLGRVFAKFLLSSPSIRMPINHVTYTVISKRHTVLTWTFPGQDLSANFSCRRVAGGMNVDVPTQTNNHKRV